MIDFDFGVQLGPLNSSSMDMLRNWRNEPEIMKWCRQTDLITDNDQTKWYYTQAEDPTIRMYLIHTNDAPAGVCGLTGIDHINGRAEFSLYIDPGVQRKGFGRMALSNLNLNLIWGESFDGNPAVKMFRSLGFVFEGTRRQFYFKNGKYIDAHLQSITAEEWRKHNGCKHT